MTQILRLVIILVSLSLPTHAKSVVLDARSPCVIKLLVSEPYSANSSAATDTCDASSTMAQKTIHTAPIAFTQSPTSYLHMQPRSSSIAEPLVSFLVVFSLLIAGYAHFNRSAK
jgi:hypothetical protein